MGLPDWDNDRRARTEWEDVDGGGKGLESVE